ncbi:hypothetical protein HDU97_001236 [Phlyctochytrium planicorne]|nr:hypothetical protein HDU97_001236 [Phlyctochytrium planicorne]
MSGLEKHLFQLKFTAKQLEREAKKATKDEATEKAKLKKAIQQNNLEGAKIYAANAIRKKNESLNFLRLASRIDATASRVQTAVTMRKVTTSMAGVVKGMEKAMQSMNLEQISLVMDKFESQFEDLDVQTSYMESSMGQSTAMSTPGDQVDELIQKVADENGLEMQMEMPGALKGGLSVGTVTVDKEQDELSQRLAKLRNEKVFAPKVLEKDREMISTLTQNQPKDIEVSQPPTDGISDLSFSPQAELLAASSWDNNTRIWEVQQNGATQPKAVITHDAPALTCCWSKDGTKLFSGGADKAGKIMDMNTGQTMQVASHDAPIKVGRFFDNPQGTLLATGSWDKTVRYWDLRAPNPVLNVQLPERCYAMDVSYPLMVVGTAERHVLIYNLNNPGTPFKQMQSPLKWQTRCIATFPNGAGFAIGSIEGRVGIQMAEEKDASLNFSFKCHRDEKGSTFNVHSVNAISFHPVYGTFSTAGSDGAFHFWDKDSKQRLKAFNPVNQSISATAFSRTGGIFAYAVSYDWSKGHEHHKQGSPNQIFLHAPKDEDIKPRPPRQKGAGGR